MFERVSKLEEGIGGKFKKKEDKWNYKINNIRFVHSKGPKFYLDENISMIISIYLF